MVEAIPVGATFGGYEILAELGAGGMGVVYRARDTTLERIVALKTLAPALSKDAAYVQRFLKEARAVARLNHPNIVQIYDFGCEEAIYYLAMEFVDGRSLGHHLRAGRFPESVALGVIRQACTALAVAHAEGLVHRDIKPDNLMLTTKGVLKLVDLGIAKRVNEDQSLTLTGQAIGTPHYVSPEQIRGQKDIDARADIYSLGATLYHLVTGRTPFTGASGALVLTMHLIEPLPDPRQYEPSLSEGLCRILGKMMAKDREERYRDVASLDADFRVLTEGGAPPGTERTPFDTTATLPAAGATAARREPAFDPVVLARIEENLAVAIGPMARVIVRRTAKIAPSLEALCEELARQLEPGSGREAFCEKCLACGRAPTGATKSPTGPRAATVLPAAGGTPPPGGAATPAGGRTPSGSRTPAFGEADLAALEAELARQIGPLARVLVRKGARGARSLSDLASGLEEQIPGPEGRQAFREGIRRRLPGT